MIVLGYGHMQGLGRGNPQLWVPPTWIKHVVFLLMIPAIVLLVAAYVPSRIRSAVGHPMLTALMIWACAHLLANGDLASVLLFGSLLGFAVYDRFSVVGRSSPDPRQRPGRGAQRHPGDCRGDSAVHAHSVLGPCQADRRGVAAMSRA